MVVSPAKIPHSIPSNSEFVSSLTYSRKCSCPSVVPCGTPDWTVEYSEYIMFTITLCF